MTNDKWRILVIEDDPDGQEVMGTILAHIDLPADVAGNAQEAERLLFETDTKYNAVVIDLALPDKDGWEILAAIQNHPDTFQLPCIAVTAFHTSKLRQEALSAGFANYFPKPIDTTAFLQALGRLI
jgi:CheY-like chemotaxis protein